MGIEILLSVLTLAYASPSTSVETVGHSVQGRAIRVHRLGDARSAHDVLVIGCIHGNETAGLAVTRRLVRLSPPYDFDLWVVRSVNPDGQRLGVRQNARGVDLNRNFGSEWIPIGQRWDPEYSGPHPWSEPETRTVRRLVRRVQPDITIWFHQPLALVDRSGRDNRIERRYARLVGLPLVRLARLHGTATSWQRHAIRGTEAFVVELPGGRPRPREVRRYARAVYRLVGP